MVIWSYVSGVILGSCGQLVCPFFTLARKRRNQNRFACDGSNHSRISTSPPNSRRSQTLAGDPNLCISRRSKTLTVDSSRRTSRRSSTSTIPTESARFELEAIRGSIMSQRKLDDEQMLELCVLDYLVTRNLMQTAKTFVSEANITNGTQSVLYQPGRGLLRGWWNLLINTPTLGAIDSKAAIYAQLSAINSDGVPLSGEPRSTDFMPTPQHFDPHRVSLPQPNTNHQADGQLFQSIPGGGSIAQHIQGVGIVDNFNVVEMPSLMHGASTMPTNYFGIGGAGFDQGTGGFLSGWGVPSTGTHGNVDPLGTNIFQSGGSDETVSSRLISQMGLKLQQLQYLLQQQNFQHQQQQQNLQQLQVKQQQQQQQELQVKQQQQQQQELLQEKQKQQLLQEQRKQQAFAQQSQEVRKRRKPTSATEAGTSKNPVRQFYPAPLLRSSIGTPGDSGTPAGPTAPTFMTPGLPVAGDSRRYLIDIDTLRDTGLLPTKQQGAKSTGSEDSLTSRNPAEPPAPSTGIPGVGLSLVRGSGNPVGPSSSATPGDGLPSGRDLFRGSGT